MKMPFEGSVDQLTLLSCRNAAIIRWWLQVVRIKIFGRKNDWTEYMIFLIASWNGERVEYLLIVWTEGGIEKVSGPGDFTHAWEAMKSDLRRKNIDLKFDKERAKLMKYLSEFQELDNSIVLKINYQNGSIVYTFRDEDGFISDEDFDEVEKVVLHITQRNQRRPG